MPFPPRPLPIVPPYGAPPPPPPPPPPPARHPTLWPTDTYTREEINAKDAAALEAAKKYVDAASAAAAEKAIGDAVGAAAAAQEAAEGAATRAGESAEAAAASAEGAAAAAETASSGARKIVESPDGKKAVTVTDGGEAVLSGGGVRIVFKFAGESNWTTLYRYQDTDWYLKPGDTPPADESSVQTFPTPCAQFGEFKVIYRKESGTVVEYSLVERYNSQSYFIQSHGGSNSGDWRFEGCDEARVVTRADLRRIACGCNDATALLTALRGLAD